MPTGTIKFLDQEKGFGFIVTQDRAEFYVRLSDIEKLDRPIKKGDLVDFCISPSQPRDAKRPHADRVTLHSRSQSERTSSQVEKPAAAESDARRTAKQESDDCLKQAQEARVKKEYDRARTLYERALEKQVSQTAFLAYGAMERELATGGNLERASRIYERALKVFPNKGKVYEDYGMLYLRTAPARAIEIFQRGLEKDPQHKMLHRHLGHALYATGDIATFAKAEHQFNLAEKAGLLDSAASLERSLVAILRGIPRGKLTIAFLEKALFQVEAITDHNRTQGFDLIARAVQPEYEESYDLSEGLWFRCLFKNRPIIPDIQDFLRRLDEFQGSVVAINRDVIFLIAQDVSGIRDYLYRLLEQPGKHPTIVPIDDALMKSVVASDNPMERLKHHLDEWLYKRTSMRRTFRSLDAVSLDVNKS